MNEALLIHIENLKQALLSLSPTAEKGFEGLIGVTLNAITGVPFRLAASGSQFGIDGKAVHAQDAICFEGKRYDNKIPKDQIFTKLFEISISDSVTDIWILGATSQVSTQIAGDAQKFSDKNGIFILILDWAETTLPPFAVALAMGGQKVEDFLVTTLDSKRHICDVKAALKAIKAHSDFNGYAQQIANECDVASVGTALAKKKNANWLSSAFSNKAMAKKRLGQPIFPGDVSKKMLQRQALINQCTPCFTTIDNSVIFALGGEGHGKSWIIAQSWLALQQQPILLFCNPEDFLACTGQSDLEPILINKLIEQTDNDNSPTVVARWQRILRLWHKQENKQAPQIVVVIDGINQKPNIDWARIIDNLHGELCCRGGRLIVTARTPYFTEFVQRRLECVNKQINVPEWLPKERDEILILHGIKPAEVRIKVANALKNPRLLDIALTLLDKQAITHFEELSISRLLFEHIRTSEKDALEPMPASVFTKQLQTDAQTILSRIKVQQTDDLYVFESDVAAVADGRFYQALTDDPTLYTLQGDGLTLALGFAIVDLLKKAKRNGRNLDNELATLLEPIQVLDDTSDVLIGALTIVVLAAATNSTDITVALIKGFVPLQNPMSNRFSVFANLVKISPQTLLAVAKELCLSGSYQRNFNWVKKALLLAGHDKLCWPNMEAEVLSWLCLHSLSPELRASNNDKRRTEDLAKINADLQSLSAGEQEVLARSAEVEDGNLGWLAKLAFKLLVGKPLAPYADVLITWKLTQVLNSQLRSPEACFIDLIRLNRVDWLATRTALLTSSKPLQREDVSSTGRWALLAILEATGDPTDGCKREKLFASLVDDPTKYVSWHLVETYCASDPCDPAAVAPQNVKKTAADYMALNINKQMQFATNDGDMVFWQGARPAGVRFFADIVVAKHRELIADVLNRKDLPLSTAMYELRGLSALLLKQDISKFVTKWRSIRTGEDVMDFTDEDSWRVPLQLLLFVFPWLSSQEQMDVMLSGHMGDKVSYPILELCKFKANKAFVSKLIKVCEDKNEPEQFLLLLLAWYVLDVVPINVRQSIVDSLHSDSQRIRERALGVALSTDDEWLIAQIVQSDYNAARIKAGEHTELYYGSRIFISAVKKKLISSEQALNRIAPTYYGEAAIELDAVSVDKIVVLVELAICCAGDIEYQLDNCVFAVNKAETQDEHKEFYRFADTLTKAKAWTFLNANKTYQIKALTDAESTLTNKWSQYFAVMSDSSIGAIGKFVMNFACMLSENDPKTAAALIQRIYNNSYTNWIYGKAEIAHDAFITWRAGSSPIFDKLRFARLDKAKTDKELAQEVVTALLEEQQTSLQNYIERQLAREEPHEVARGIMVAGFADNSDFNTEVLTRFTNENGLIGKANKAANYAYERNVWARHWFGLMNSTKDPVDFWRYKVLFVKLVDKRFELWQHEFVEDKGECNKQFAHTYDDDVKRRYDSWDKHREKTLFGEKAPKPIFLNLDNNGVAV